MKSSERAWAIILILISIFYYEVKYSTKKVYTKVKNQIKKELKDFDFKGFDFEFGSDDLFKKNYSLIEKKSFEFRNVNDVEFELRRAEIEVLKNKDKKVVVQVEFLGEEKNELPKLETALKNRRLLVKSYGGKEYRLKVKALVPQEIFLRLKNSHSKIVVKGIKSIEAQNSYSSEKFYDAEKLNVNSRFGKVFGKDLGEISVKGKYLNVEVEKIKSGDFSLSYSNLKLKEVEKILMISNKFGRIELEKTKLSKIKGSYLKISLFKTESVELNGKWNSVSTDYLKSFKVSGKYNTIEGRVEKLELYGRNDTLNVSIKTGKIVEEGGTLNISFKDIKNTTKIDIEDGELKAEISDRSYYLFVENIGGNISSDFGNIISRGNRAILETGSKNSKKRIIIKSKYSTIRIETDHDSSIEI